MDIHPLLNDIAASHIKKLQVMQNKILKMYLNKPWQYSTEALHQEALVEKIKDFISRLTLKFESSPYFSETISIYTFSFYCDISFVM